MKAFELPSPIRSSRRTPSPGARVETNRLSASVRTHQTESASTVTHRWDWLAETPEGLLLRGFQYSRQMLLVWACFRSVLISQVSLSPSTSTQTSWERPSHFPQVRPAAAKRARTRSSPDCP